MNNLKNHLSLMVAVILAHATPPILQASEPLPVTVNPDKRGIAFDKYGKVAELKAKLRRAKPANECSPAELEANARLFSSIAELEMELRENPENQRLLQTIYSVNPDAFKALARLYSRILPDRASEKKYKQSMDAESMRLVMSMPQTLMGGISKQEKQAHDEEMAESEEKPIIFYITPEYFTSEQKDLLTQFNALEKKLREVYPGVPAVELEMPFFRALGQARAEVSVADSQSALEAMAINIRKIQPGASNAEEVVALLGKPTSRISQENTDVLKYKYFAKKEVTADPSRPDLLYHTALQASDEAEEDFVVADISCDTLGKVRAVSVVKTSAGNGAVEEIYKAGEKITGGATTN
jgi:hypothetical protein